MTVQFGRYKCHVRFSKYNSNSRTAIYLDDANDGEPVTTATVNLPDYPLKENEVIIKTWSENEGILEVLENAKILKRTGKKVPTGFVEAEVCELLQ